MPSRGLWDPEVRSLARPGMAFFLVAAFLTSAAACALSPRRSMLAAGSAVITSVPAPARLRALLVERYRELDTFRGQARLEYEAPSDKARLSQMIIVQDPNKIRIVVMSPFGPSYTVVSDGHELIAYDRGEKVMYQGRPTASNVSRYTKVPLKLPVLASLLRGLPLLPPVEAEGKVERIDRGWQWTVLDRGGGRMQIVFDTKHRRPLSIDVAGWPEIPDLSASFADYRSVSGLFVPHEIRAELSGGVEVRLFYDRIWRKKTFDERAFELEAPAGVRVVEMDEEAMVEKTAE